MTCVGASCKLDPGQVPGSEALMFDMRFRVILIFLTSLSALILCHAGEATLLGGQYYLHGICTDGDIYCGTGYDIGIMNREKPLEYGERNCACWIQFNFQLKRNFPADSELVIHAIYYHIWWRLDADRGWMGYDTTGSISAYTDESFPLAVAPGIITVDGYHLAAATQPVDPQFSIITGDQVSGFSIKLVGDNQNPSIVSSPRFPSYIIINPDPESELRARDSDNDGLSDYTEMYTTFTDPLRPDTDSDGVCDFVETRRLGYHKALDSEDAPVFGNPVLRRVDGMVPDGNFGNFLSAPGDIDGDGGVDIAVGYPAGNRVMFWDRDLNPVLTLDAAVPGCGFGKSVAVLHVTGKGCGKIAVGAPDLYVGSGGVFLFDCDGNPESQIPAPCAGKLFGSALCTLDDLNGDGVQELAVSAPGTRDSTASGDVYIYSGADLTLLNAISGSVSGDMFGYAIHAVPDPSDPSVSTALLIGAPGDSETDYLAGAVYFYGPGQALLHRWNGTDTRQMLGSSLCTIGDQDADGLPDLAVSAPYSDTLNFPEVRLNGDWGKIYLFSSGDYTCLRELSAGTWGDHLGGCMVSIPDADGDGLEDIAATTWRCRYRKNSLVILSSRDQLLWRFVRGNARTPLVSNLVALGDQTGDGNPEYLFGAPNFNSGTQISDPGALFVVTQDIGIPDNSLNNPFFNPADYFSDPDGDVLVYTTVQVEDTSEQSKYIFIAQDPSGRSCASNAFSQADYTPLPGLTPVPTDFRTSR